MARPGVLPLVIVRGDTSTIELQRQKENKEPHNIANRTYAAQIRPVPGSDTLIATYTCAIVGDGSTGVVVCTLSATTTAALEPCAAAWDIEERNGTVVDTIIGGPVSIIDGVTE